MVKQVQAGDLAGHLPVGVTDVAGIIRQGRQVKITGETLLVQPDEILLDHIQGCFGLC